MRSASSIAWPNGCNCAGCCATITAARLDVVAELRRMAEGRAPVDARVWAVLNDAAHELERAIRAADADKENENG